MQPLAAPALLVLAGVLTAPYAARAQSIDRARQLFQDANYSEAKAELMALQRANAADAEAAYYLGQIAERRGTTAVAREHYEAAVKLNPRSPARKALGALR